MELNRHGVQTLDDVIVVAESPTDYSAQPKTRGLTMIKMGERAMIGDNRKE